MKQSMRRLLTLERVRRPGRLVCIWDDGTGAAQIKAAALEQEHGSAVDIRIIGWLREQANDAPADPPVLQ